MGKYASNQEYIQIKIYDFKEQIMINQFFKLDFSRLLPLFFMDFNGII